MTRWMLGSTRGKQEEEKGRERSGKDGLVYRKAHSNETARLLPKWARWRLSSVKLLDMGNSVCFCAVTLAASRQHDQANSSVAGRAARSVKAVGG